MRTHTTITALLTAITLALALAATAAGARSFQLSEREFEVLFRELRFEAAGNNISCPITLLGHSFERTIPKSGAIGVVRHIEPSTSTSPPCTGGTMTILNETLPWRVNYVSFRGTLPNITAIRESIIGMAFRVSISGLGCLAGTTSLKPAFGETLVGTGGGITGFRIDETVRIPLGGGFICEIAGESSFSGSGTVLNLPRNASVTITLI